MVILLYERERERERERAFLPRLAAEPISTHGFGRNLTTFSDLIERHN
jgi:hypothetical protein